MANIKLRTGEILYEFPSEVAHALICLGLAEKYSIPAPDKKPGVLRFALERPPISREPCIRFACDSCSQGGYLLNSHPHGVPGHGPAQFAEDTARAFTFWHCGKKEVLPEALIQQFKESF